MKNIVLVLSMFFCNTLFAGNASELIAEIKGRTLVVVLESTIKPKYDKLKEEDKVAYSKAVENYNRKLREVTDSFWVINKKVEYKTWEQAEELIKSGSKSYLLLYAGNYSVQPSAIEMIQKGLKFYPNIFADGDKREYMDYFTSYKLCFIEDFRKGKYLVARTISNIWPLKEDMVFAYQYIQCILKETERTGTSMDVQKAANSYNAELSNSTLYLKKDITDNSVNDATLRKYYSADSKIVSRDTLLASIMEKRNIVYVEVVPVWVGTGEANRLSYEHVAMNASKGVIVGYSAPNYGVLHATMGNGTFFKYVSVGSLEKYLSSHSNDQHSNEQRE